MNSIVKSLSYTAKSVGFLWKHGKLYLFLTAIGIALGAVSVFPGVYLARYSIDLLTRRAEIREYLLTIAVIIAVMFGVSLIQSLLGSVTGLVRDGVYTRIRGIIRDICLYTDWENVQSKSFLEKKDFALNVLNEGRLESLINSIQIVVRSAVVVAGMIFIITEVSLWVLIPLVLSIAMVVPMWYRNSKQTYVEDHDWVEWERKDRYLSDLAKDFSFAKEVRLFNLRDKFQSRLDDIAKFKADLLAKSPSRRIPSFLTLAASNFVFEASIYLYLGYLVIVPATVTLGAFAMYASALRQFKSALESLTNEVVMLPLRAPYLKDFFDFLETKTVDKQSSETSDIAQNVKSVEIIFDGVGYCYPGAERYALKNVNLKIKTGESLLIVGENGAGKSTFAKLLCGLLHPTEGKILIGGVDTATIPHGEYMRNISAVFQDFQLFSVPIWDNIAAMHSRVGDRLNNAIAQVNLAPAIAELPNGIETTFGREFDETGAEMSGGQAQRLAIARAVYKESPVLVLDEPTSAIDPRAEHEIFSAFKRIHNNRTTVFISHRMSSSRFTDKIAVFSDGELVEYGEHESLSAQNGIYSEMYNMQAELYREEDAV
ncbi:ABC transporter ATP-binding protein [Clostridia bacterium]|nr:ABC transporter ATP-binding protein [Clostridia bacterium]